MVVVRKNRITKWLTDGESESDRQNEHIRYFFFKSLTIYNYFSPVSIKVQSIITELPRKIIKINNRKVSRQK